MEKDSYLLPWTNRELYSQPDPETRAKIGDHSPITRFVKTLMSLLASGAARPHLKHLTELFRLFFRLLTLTLYLSRNSNIARPRRLTKVATSVIFEMKKLL